MLEESGELPRTSQPPPRDFKRVFSLLESHGYEVLHVGLSSVLSGTTRAAQTAASGFEGATIRVIDSLNASSGQGLLAMVAAEMAVMGLSVDEVESVVQELIMQTETLAMPDDLSWAVRGGRVPVWLKRTSDLLRITPILRAKHGKLGLSGVSSGRGFSAKSLAAHAVKRMRRGQVYRLMIAHVDNVEGARKVRQFILAQHSMIHSCHVTEAGPALGAHLGRGGVIIGFLPQPELLTV
jgi:DegV family protein with EDD domain